MMPRRQQSPIGPGPMAQPVRFYKVVALTFLVLTIVLLGMVLFMSTKRATITIMTSATPVDVSTVVTIGEDVTDSALQGVVTSTIVTLSELFQPTGEDEQPGFAEGTVTLVNDSDRSQPLVKTTRLLTPEGVLFRIQDGVTVPANGQVTVLARADKEGKSGNVGPTSFTIPGLNESRQKEVYARVESALTGGVRVVGVLSTDDIKRSEKILLEKLEERANDILSAQVEDEDLASVFSIEGKTFTVDKEIGEEVDGFTITGTATVIGVFYDEEGVIAKARKKLNTRAIDDTEIVKSVEGGATITFESYDRSDNVALLDVFSSGTAELNPESTKLQKSEFFGKTKDEVRRYLLTLDHVSGVEVKLQPAWVGRVPQVADHVRIVVTKTQ